MRLKIVFLFLLTSFSVFANERVLKKFYGTKHFYNFTQNKNGIIYVGSNEGVFKISNSSLVKVNKKPGYVSFERNEMIISGNGQFEKHYKYKDLLPAAYGEYWQQSVETDNFIYIICRGSLFIFKILEYKTYMKGLSIRSFSKNSVGSYNGIYCYNKKIELPTYTSGKILEVDSTFYICYDGLALYRPNNKSIIYTQELTGETKIGKFSIGFSRDIRQLKDKRFLLSTTKGLYVLDEKLESAKQIMESKDNVAPIIVDVFEEDYTNTVTFTIDKQLYRYGFRNRELIKLTNLFDTAQDGLKNLENPNTEYLILTENSIIKYDYNKKEKEVIDGLYGAYSLIALENNNVLIISLNGAYFLNLITQEVTHIFDGIEFNKRAVFKSKDTIKLGTINGFMTFSNKDLEKIVKEILVEVKEKENSSLIKIVLGILTLTTIIVIIIFFRKKRIYVIKKNNVTLIEIEKFIKENLNQVTIQSITEHFNISNKLLYTIVMPYKPGKLITQFRLDKVSELRLKGESIERIAMFTGFSVSYLRKIKY